MKGPEGSADDPVAALLGSLPHPADRARLNAEFAATIPSAEPELEAAVLRGILRSVLRPVPVVHEAAVRNARHEQGGPALPALAGRSARFERERPARIVAAVKECGRDAEADEARWRNAWQRALETQLPTPPAGYHWRRQRACFELGGGHTFRLWRRDLGYMPWSA
jgi:hypothetical protein